MKISDQALYESKFLNINTCKKIIIKLVLFFVFLAISDSPVLAWKTFTLRSGASINTNNRLSLINGYHRVTVFEHDNTDNEQMIEPVKISAGGYVLVHKQLSEYYKRAICIALPSTRNRGEVIAKTCNRKDKAQAVALEPTGRPNEYKIRRGYSNQCYSVSPPHENKKQIIGFDCKAHNTNQFFTMKDQPGENPWDIDHKKPPQTKEYVTVGDKHYYDVEIWLVARNREIDTFASLQNGYEFSSGHVFIGVVGREKNSGVWSPIKTFSYWPDTDLTINHQTDFDNLKKLLNGKSISEKGHAIRKSKVSAKRAVWFMNEKYKQTHCRQYRIFGESIFCNCADYSTNMWYDITSGWDDVRVGLEHNKKILSPDQLVYQMNVMSNQKQSEFVDTKIWE